MMLYQDLDRVVCFYVDLFICDYVGIMDEWDQEIFEKVVVVKGNEFIYNKFIEIVCIINFLDDFKFNKESGVCDFGGIVISRCFLLLYVFQLGFFFCIVLLVFVVVLV